MPVADPGRRRWLKRAILGGGALIAGGGLYAWRIEPHWVEVTRTYLPIPRLGRDLDGYRIVHICDLHTGDNVSTTYLCQCMDRVSALRPDLVVVTGDLITGGLANQIATAASVLGRVQSRDGLIVTLGNHDYHNWTPGQVRLDVADRLVAALEKIGARVLRNQSHVISRGESKPTLVGLDELMVHRCDARAAFAGVAPNLPVIILIHNPDSMEFLRDCAGTVVLAGHTHGGQVRLPFFGPVLLAVTNSQWSMGLIHVGSNILYVNRGLGHLTRVRFNCRPEIAVHRLCSVEA